MGVSLVRSRAMITKTLSATEWEEVADGAVLVEDGLIAAVGTFDDLQRKHPTVDVVGTGKEILLPGFVNGHHHVGLTPVQLGSPDMPLELWFITRMVARNLNIYLDTLYSAFEMISSGITTVQHIHGWLPGKLAEVEARSGEVIRAYEDIGMRVSYCFALRDQNRLVYQADDDFVASLPTELRGPMQRWFERFQLTLDDSLDLFRNLHSAHNAKRRVKVQLAPANLHWCSDAALTALAELSRSYDAPMHMHLNETAYQKEYAKRRGGGTAVEYRAHRIPGMEDADVPGMAQVLRMATTGGARTTPFRETLGTLEVGKGADLSLIDWESVAYPYLDELTPLLDAVIQRAKASAVRTVMCDGEVIYQDGTFTKVDRDGALRALHDDLAKALSDDEVERRHLSKALLPHARRFYAGYIDPARHEPFYRPSSRV